MTKNKHTQSDNSHLSVKLSVRRTILDILDDKLNVVDCCAAGGAIWGCLKNEYDVGMYLPFDIKPKMAGTVKMDSRDALVCLDLQRFNVIDIDTYGEPWTHLAAITRRIKQETAVFMTHGHVPSVGGVTLSNVSKQLCGIPLDWDIPRNRNLPPFVASYCLTRCCDDCKIIASKVWCSPNVDYYGLILTKKGC